jgi:hypothetical protein
MPFIARRTDEPLEAHIPRRTDEHSAQRTTHDMGALLRPAPADGYGGRATLALALFAALALVAHVGHSPQQVPHYVVADLARPPPPLERDDCGGLWDDRVPLGEAANTTLL